MPSDVSVLLRGLGWRVRYVPHRVIKDYNACYRVVYRGRVIAPPAADRLGIPLNEIWLSEELRGFEKYVLFHELREIVYRYLGHGVDEAHLLARVDEALMFCKDPQWMEYFRRFPDSAAPLRCLQELCNAIDQGAGASEVLYGMLIECAGSGSRQVLHHGRGS